VTENGREIKRERERVDMLSRDYFTARIYEGKVTRKRKE
jgi:hypothetical protein